MTRAALLRFSALVALALFVGALIGACAPAEEPAAGDAGTAVSADWSWYAADKSASKYSPLDNITADNFGDLEIAWQWESPDNAILAANPDIVVWRYESTPLAIDGILYTTTSMSQATAIDGATGEVLWTYDPGSWQAGYPPNVGYVHRGATMYDGPDGTRWLIYGTGDAHLIALDAATGEPVVEFGDNGRIDLTQGLRREIDRQYYGVTTPPMVCGGNLILGASVFDLNAEKYAPPRRRARHRPGHRHDVVDFRIDSAGRPAGRRKLGRRLLGVVRQRQHVDVLDLR